MAHLFEPFTLRGLALRNRIAVPPMCQYSATNGPDSDWGISCITARAPSAAPR
jgi:2,4-dienoyl-CoA reductase-like NADH-dependent reductase (Old Yellow Enzyme family)